MVFFTNTFLRSNPARKSPTGPTAVGSSWQAREVVCEGNHWFPSQTGCCIPGLVCEGNHWFSSQKCVGCEQRWRSGGACVTNSGRFLHKKMLGQHVCDESGSRSSQKMFAATPLADRSGRPPRPQEPAKAGKSVDTPARDMRMLSK